MYAWLSGGLALATTTDPFQGASGQTTMFVCHSLAKQGSNRNFLPMAHRYASGRGEAIECAQQSARVFEVSSGKGPCEVVEPAMSALNRYLSVATVAFDELGLGKPT